MFAFIEHIAVCLAGGFFVALVLVLLALFVAGRLLERTATPVAVVLLGVVAVFLWLQGTLLCGGLYARSYVDDLGEVLTGWQEQADSVASSSSGRELTARLDREFPALRPFMGPVSETVSSCLPDMVQGVRAEVNAFLWRRVAWMGCGFVLAVAGFGVAGRPLGGGARHRDYRAGSGRTTARRTTRAPRRRR